MAMSDNTEHNTLAELVRRIAQFMNLDCHVEIHEEVHGSEKILCAAIYTPSDARFLIGKNGQNLKAFEQVVRLLYARTQSIPNSMVTVDVNDYRKSRTLHVVELARQAVSRVRNTQKPEALLPMSSYERRVVHMELAVYPDIATESIGDDPNRRVVIKPFP